MPQRVEIFIRRLAKYLSRSQLLIRLFGLTAADKQALNKGLVIIQIDALSRKQLEKAIAAGKVPFIKCLLDRQHYRLHTHYSGMPCSTAVVQAELFYGVKSAVPGFTFYDFHTSRVFTMYNPADSLEIENRLQKQGRPLLAGGVAYSNIYTGGAEESHFCISALGIRRIFKDGHVLGFIVLIILHFYSLVRTAALLAVELGLAVFDFFKGLIKGHDLWKELKFVPSRVAMCVLLRELIVIGAKADIARGIAVVHLNLVGYHEQSHRRGSTSRFAHWTLQGIDNAVKRIWTAAHRSTREYEVWIYSDHGQIDTIPYEKKFSKSIGQAVIEALDESQVYHGKKAYSSKNGFLVLAGLRKSKFMTKILQPQQDPASKEPIVTALGPMGHIYLKEKLDSAQMEQFVDRLIRTAHIPTVILSKEGHGKKLVEIWTEETRLTLPEQAKEIFDSDAPFFREMAEDFTRACGNPDMGDLMICGWDRKTRRCYSFAMENGSHGGITTEEAEGFALFPRQTVISDVEKGYVRPLDIRTCALRILDGKKEKLDKTFSKSSLDKNTLRIMTYNVHGCVGMDGKLSPSRIAEVILQYEPDIAALQELDVGRFRSGKVDQAMLIADYLNMTHHFHPAMRIAEESFGDAILSSYPMRLIKKSGLSQNRSFSFFETRGAVWIEVDFGTAGVQIVNTHLGLNPQERQVQAADLLGERWLKHPACRKPVIVCGDFNAMPGSKVFNMFQNSLCSIQLKAGGNKHKSTWGGRYPVACLDHIFVSSGVEVIRVEVCDSYLARLASDHRPIIADLRIP